MENILLSNEFGLNPVIMSCPRCGRPTNEIALLGKAYDYKCSCGVHIYERKVGNCPSCNASNNQWKRMSHKEVEVGRKKIMATHLCDDCKKEITTFKKTVSEGGVYWKCEDCPSNGVIKKNEFTEMVREKMGLNVPGPKGYPPIGVAFTKKDCPSCGKEKDVDNI